MPYAEKRDHKLTGFWYGEVVIKATGERFRERFETRKEAKGYEDYIKATGKPPENSKTAKLGGPTLREVAALMRSKKPLTKKQTASKYKSEELRRSWVIGHLGHLTFAGITTAVLDTMIETLEARPQTGQRERMSDSTINRYLSAFSGIRTWAYERDKTIPLETIPWRKEGGRRLHWFSEAQEAVLVPYLVGVGEGAVALSTRVLCATGMRWGEFAGLEPHQCQPEWILLDETKTDTPRDVPIDPDLARELKAMVVSGTMPNYWHMRTRIRDAVKACGYSPKLGIHNMRHGTATQLVKGNTPLPVVQKFMGHKKIETTMKYVHVEAEDLKEASRNLRPRRGYLPSEAPQSTVVAFVKSVG